MRTDKPDENKRDAVLCQTQEPVCEGFWADLCRNARRCFSGVRCKGKTASKQRCKNLPLGIHVTDCAIRQQRSGRRSNDCVQCVPHVVEKRNLVYEKFN